MAAARLRLLASRIHAQAALLAKCSISHYQAKSGLWVPEGYEEGNKSDYIKGLIAKTWYKIDESARGAIIQTTTKYVLTASGGGSLILLNMGRGRLNALEERIDAINKEQQEVKDMIKAESVKTEEKLNKSRQDSEQLIFKVEVDIKTLRIASQLWLFRLMANNFNQEVLSGARLQDLYDPVKLLKSIDDPKEPLTKEQLQINKLKMVFTIHDENKDGYLTIEELGELMMFLGKNFSESQLGDMIKAVEADGNRGVDFSQFLTLMELKGTGNEDHLRAAFQLADKNNDGYISGTELRPVLVALRDTLSEERIEEMIETVEKNGGRVTYATLKQMILG